MENRKLNGFLNFFLFMIYCSSSSEDIQDFKVLVNYCPNNEYKSEIFLPLFASEIMAG